MQLYHTGRMTLPDLIEKFTVNPAALLNLKKGALTEGADADVTVFDPDAAWTFTHEATASKSTNSPFYGWPLRGRAIMTIVAGRVVWNEPRRAQR